MPLPNPYLHLGLDNRPVFNMPGARCVLLVNKTSVFGVVSSATDANIIDDVLIGGNTKWNLFNEPESLSYTCTPSFSEAGTLYTVDISFTVNGKTSDKNALFRSMEKTKLTAIVQDYNNMWWLVGSEQPLVMTEAPRTTNGDVNQYVIKLSGTQRDDEKQMSADWVNALTDDSFTAMIDAVDGATSLVTMDGAVDNSGENQLPNNFLNTITVSVFQSGLVIPSHVGIVYASAGVSVKLPPTGTLGQYHTVKDISGIADASNITIDGNGRNIDGTPTVAKITTPYGAMTFTYSPLGWMTSAFVN